MTHRMASEIFDFPEPLGPTMAVMSSPNRISVIRVEAAQEGEDLLITVTDNGHGLPPDMIGHPYRRESAPSGHHLGLFNVDTILKKHYGERYGLYLDNNPAGSGARVRARLPLRRREEEEC